MGMVMVRWTPLVRAVPLDPLLGDEISSSPNYPFPHVAGWLLWYADVGRAKKEIVDETGASFGALELRKVERIGFRMHALCKICKICRL